MSIWQASKTAANNASNIDDVNWAEGQAASSVNDSAREMLADIAEYLDDSGFTLTSGGTTSALTLTTNAGIDSLTNGRRVSFRAGSNANAAATLNVDGEGAKALVRRSDGSAIEAGDIVSGGFYEVVYSTAADGGSGGWIVLQAGLNGADVVGNVTVSGTFTSSGVVAFPAGSAAAPGLIVSGDTDSGLYQIGANDIGMSCAGSLVMSWGVSNRNVSKLPFTVEDEVVAERFLSGTVTINDDAAASLTPPKSSGLFVIYGAFQTAILIYYTAGPSTAFLGNTSSVEQTTGVLAGTTGNDTKLTLSCHTDGDIYIENRLGSQTAFRYMFWL